MKRFISFFTAAVMLLTVFDISAAVYAEPIVLTDSNGITYTLTENAETEENEASKSGFCGDNVSWVIDSDGLLTISGSGGCTIIPVLFKGLHLGLIITKI